MASTGSLELIQHRRLGLAGGFGKIVDLHCRIRFDVQIAKLRA
jgi:hypothetical protein